VLRRRVQAAVKEWIGRWNLLRLHDYLKF
jgi:hypothetical protein